MTSVSAGHITLTPTQPVWSGRPEPGSNPQPPHQESLYRLSHLPSLFRTFQNPFERKVKGIVVMCAREKRPKHYPSIYMLTFCIYPPTYLSIVRLFTDVRTSSSKMYSLYLSTKLILFIKSIDSYIQCHPCHLVISELIVLKSEKIIIDFKTLKKKSSYVINLPFYSCDSVVCTVYHEFISLTHYFPISNSILLRLVS